jgi:hypothetical protein
MRLGGQRGEGRMGFFVALAVFCVGVFLAVKFVPEKINAYEFRETLREEAKNISVHRNDRQALERILDRADALNLPVTEKNIDIRRTQSEVIVSAKYEKPIDLKFTVYKFKFEEEMRAPLF